MCNRLRVARDVSLTVLALYALLVLTGRPAVATSKSVSLLKSPAAPLTLTHNVVTPIPGTYCTVIIRNHAANPVYYGGPKINGVSVSGITVNTSGALAICTDTAACASELFSGNVLTGGMALLSAIDTTVTYEEGEGCSP